MPGFAGPVTYVYLQYQYMAKAGFSPGGPGGPWPTQIFTIYIILKGLNNNNMKSFSSVNPYSKFNSANVLSSTTSPLPGGLYSTAHCKFPDLLVEISIASRSGRSAYLCHLGHFLLVT